MLVYSRDLLLLSRDSRMMIGIVRVKVLPWPIPADWTCTFPPVNSTIFFTIVSPKPMPSLLIVAVRWIFPKRLKSVSISSAAMPCPVSLTLILSCSLGACVYDAWIEILPNLVNFMAFFTKLISTYFRRLSSPTNFGMSSSGHSSSFWVLSLSFSMMAVISIYLALTWGAKISHTCLITLTALKG